MATPGRGYEIKFPEARKVSQGLLKSLLPEMVELVAIRARAIAPRQSGGLAESIEGRVEEEGPRGVIAATARHAFIVHQGTKAHTALAKDSKALTIYSGASGRPVLRKSMQHPGTKGQPFLTDAVEESKGPILSGLSGNERALKEAIEGAR